LDSNWGFLEIGGRGMKTIKDIDSKPIYYDENASENIISQMPSFRKMFRNAIGKMGARTGEEALDLFALGIKFKSSSSDISLEDAEFKLLSEVCEKNPDLWMSHFQAQVLLKLKEAE
jgi:hypothetical protein